MPPSLIMEACDELAARRDRIYKSLNALQQPPVRKHRAHRRPSAWKAFWSEVWRPLKAAL